MNDHVKYKSLLKKKIEGIKWLKKYGKKTDEEEFQDIVLKPIKELRNKFTLQELNYWDKIEKVIEIFNGKIVE